MKHRIYVVAVARKDGKLPGAEKIVNGLFFHELRDAKEQLDACQHADKYEFGGPMTYRIYEATIEIDREVKQ